MRSYIAAAVLVLFAGLAFAPGASMAGGSLYLWAALLIWWGPISGLSGGVAIIGLGLWRTRHGVGPPTVFAGLRGYIAAAVLVFVVGLLTSHPGVLARRLSIVPGGPLAADHDHDRSGADPRPRRLAHPASLTLADSNWSNRQIAAVAGVSHDTVNRAARGVDEIVHVDRGPVLAPTTGSTPPRGEGRRDRRRAGARAKRAVRTGAGG